MLRYAQNIANGYGVVYNPGGAPVWGCTSMLMTVLLAFLIRIGLSPIPASQALGFTQAVALIFTVYFIERRVLALPKAPALISCVVLASSQIVALALMGFDAILFSLLMVILFGLSVWIIKHPSFTDVGFVPFYALYFVGILLSLARVEGALVTVSTFIVILWIRRDINRSRFLTATALPYILSIIAFYAWSTLYFGYPFPNPLYVKSGNMLIYPSSIAMIAGFLVLNIVPVIFVSLWLLLVNRIERREIILLSIPAALYAIAYLAIHQLQNIEFRFQIPLLPILVISFALAVNRLLPELPKNLTIKLSNPNRHSLTKLVLVTLLVGSLVHPVVTRYVSLPWGEMPDALQVGVVLHKYNDRGYTMLATEAGRLPFYAGWRTIDGYGLNDPTIAHYGLTDDYIASNNPELIMFWNQKYAEYSAEWAASTDSSDMICEQLYLYSVNHGYTLACIFKAYVRAGPHVYHAGYQWYFLRPDFSESDTIIHDLRSISVLDYVYPT